MNNQQSIGREADFARLKEELPPEVYVFLRAMIAVSDGELDICPRCGADITDMRQIGRCVYAGCGCRLYQGWLPEKWHKPIDRVRIGISMESLSWWERILYWLAKQFLSARKRY